MGKLLLAGIGGFIGSSLRYAVSGYIQVSSQSIRFPFGTLAVNLIGCLAIGFFSQLAESRGMFTAETRTLVFIGVLGGFTTFSAFGNETINLWRDGENLLGGQCHCSPVALSGRGLAEPSSGLSDLEVKSHDASGRRLSAAHFYWRE